MDRRTAPGSRLPGAGDVPIRSFGPDELSAVRREAIAHARAAGFSADRCTDVAIVVSELTTNSVVHGGSGGGTIRSWYDGDAVVHEVTDAGVVETGDVPRQLPPVDQPGGRGLWLVDHLSDEVTRHRSATGGTTTTVVLGPRPAPGGSPVS